MLAADSVVVDGRCHMEAMWLVTLALDAVTFRVEALGTGGSCNVFQALSFIPNRKNNGTNLTIVADSNRAVQPKHRELA